MYAAAPTGDHITATPGATGTCPGCNSPLVPKCGQLTAWHWAHKATDCDPWSEPTTAWHLNWQRYAPAERVEVPIGHHRADIVTPDGRVIEVQHSGISTDEIRAREQHYSQLGPMAWIFDARDAYTSGRLEWRQQKSGGYRTFRWKHPRRSLTACTQTVFLDLGGSWLLQLRLIKISDSGKCGGWGYLWHADRVRALITGQSAQLQRAA